MQKVTVVSSPLLFSFPFFQELSIVLYACFEPVMIYMYKSSEWSFVVVPAYSIIE